MRHPAGSQGLKSSPRARARAAPGAGQQREPPQGMGAGPAHQGRKVGEIQGAKEEGRGRGSPRRPGMDADL